MMAARLANLAWMLQCRPEAMRYTRAANDVERTQSTLLQQILAHNADTEFGRDHQFSRIRTAREYQSRVPVCSYETLSNLIQRIANGETGVLTREPVLMFEPTSGSSGPDKLIPYTRSLKRQFQRAICAWVYDTFSQRPNLRRGRSYLSLSPALDIQRTTPGGLTIGFDNDSQYLSLPQRLASAHLLAVDPTITRLEIENFRYATLLQLLQAADLTTISIWSPTFLTMLLGKLDEWWPAICYDIGRGSVNWPQPRAVDPRLDRIMLRRRNPRRAAYLSTIFRGAASSVETFSRVWPHLGLISCWTDASAAQYLPGLQTLFANVEFQSKGLVATEGIVSIPRFGHVGTALAVRSHFFEFQEQQWTAEQNGESYGPFQLAHELEAGRTYRVILTTGGGLYRYQLGDLVKVLGFWKQCPLIRFLGRSTASSDLVGEKLHERHVRDVLRNAFVAEAIAPSFSLLVPVADNPPRYVLYLQGDGIKSTLSLRQRLAKRLQAGLEENLYYRHAVQLGQLAEAQVIVLDPQRESGWQIFETGCIANGQRPGDIKPVALHSGTQWAAKFAIAEPDVVDDR